MPFEHEPRVRELIALIAHEADANARKELCSELEQLLRLEREPLSARDLEIPRR